MGKVQRKKGFTIIETMLVLSISGLLAVGIMAGWSVNIQRQRYEDSVNTFKSDIQQVFSDVENTDNSRLANVSCDTSGASVVLKKVSENRGNRGTTGCVILGKAISFGDGTAAIDVSSVGGYTAYSNANIVVRDVVGADIDVSTACSGKPCANALDALIASKFVVVDDSVSPSSPISLEWDSSYKNVTSNRNYEFSGSGIDSKGARINTILGSGKSAINTGRSSTIIGVVLILRSPIDGTIMTFGVPVFSLSSGILHGGKDAASFSQWAIDSNLLMSDTKTVNICVRSSASGVFGAGLTVFGRNKVLRIGNSASSVQIAPLDGDGASYCSNGTGFGGTVINGRSI